MARQIKTTILKHIRENESIYLFTAVLFLMGIIFGAIVVNSLTFTQKQDLFMYVSRFFGQVMEGQLANATLMFQESFMHNAKYIGLMWLLGISIIGLPIILIFIFLKGIVVGFTVGFLVNQIGWYGFLLSLVSILPQNFILIPTFIVVGAASIMFSLKMIRQQFIKKAHEPIFPYFAKYTFLMVLTIGLVGIASSIEAFVSPTMMKSIVSLFHNN